MSKWIFDSQVNAFKRSFDDTDGSHSLLSTGCRPLQHLDAIRRRLVLELANLFVQLILEFPQRGQGLFGRVIARDRAAFLSRLATPVPFSCQFSLPRFRFVGNLTANLVKVVENRQLY